MKTIIVLGSGNSGAGAIRDYLMARQDFQSPFGKQEFRIINDPDGLNDLYFNLYENFSINNAANAVYNFFLFINNSYNSRLNKRKKIYNKNIISLTKNYISKIIKVEYNGAPRFYLDKINNIKKVNFYFSRFVLKKNAKNIKLLKMIVPVSKKQFLKYTQNYIFNIFKQTKNFNLKKNIVIEQGGNFWKPVSSTIFYGNDRKIILVSRDPKAIYSSMKNRNSLSYPGNDIKIFVKWYKNIMLKKDKKQHSKVIKVEFEKFFENFKIESKKLCRLLKIKNDINHKFVLENTVKNLYKYKKSLSRKEISYINKHLSEYIK
tara:strand:+ start:41 stop:994 length:954 start_codon:yes stop_codon:yes gene_type:complete